MIGPIGRRVALALGAACLAFAIAGPAACSLFAQPPAATAPITEGD